MSAADLITLAQIALTLACATLGVLALYLEIDP